MDNSPFGRKPTCSRACDWVNMGNVMFCQYSISLCIVEAILVESVKFTPAEAHFCYTGEVIPQHSNATAMATSPFGSSSPTIPMEAEQAEEAPADLDLPLTIAASIVLDQLPRDAHKALETAGDVDREKGSPTYELSRPPLTPTSHIALPKFLS
nr:ubiquitin-like protein atg12 [Quercus suber]